MDHPLLGLEIAPAASTGLPQKEEMSPQHSVSMKSGSMALSEMVERDGGCEIECLEGREEKDAVCMPQGAEPAVQELEWEARHDPVKGESLFIRPNNTTEKTWKLPTVADATLPRPDYPHAAGKTKFQRRVEEVAEAVEALGLGSETMRRGSEGEKGLQELGRDPGTACVAVQRRSDRKGYVDSSVCAVSHAILLHKSQTDDSFQNAFLPITGTPPSPAPLRDDKTPIDCMQRGESHSLVSGEKEPVPTESDALLSLMNAEESVCIPPTSRSIGRYLSSTPHEWHGVADVVSPAKGVHSVFLQLELVELEHDAAARIAEEEHVARCFLEEEEVNGRDALLNAFQTDLDAPDLCNLGVEGNYGHTTPPADMKSSSPVLDTSADQNDFFLRNTRLSSIMDDEAVTPLEKLLRDSSPNVSHPLKFNSPATGAYTNIYEPPSSKADLVTPQVSLGPSNIGLRAKNAPQTLPSEADRDHLSPWCLLETQRHQLEMERRLTQRDRDNLERTLDARHQCIQIPPDTHAQLRYEPSDSFTRERQLILGSLGIPSHKMSRADTSTPQQGEGKNGHQHHHHHQEQPPQERLRPQAHKKGSIGVGVSPISSHALVSSPSPAIMLTQKPSPGETTIFAEACETKYTESLAAMRELIELYQAFIRTKPGSNPPHEGLQIQPYNSDMNESAASSTETYETRLARIKHLYPSFNNRTSLMHHYRRLLYTPPLPPSLEPANITDGASQNCMSASVKGSIMPLRNSVGNAGNTRKMDESGLARYSSHLFGASCESGARDFRQEAKLTSFAVDENDGKHCALSGPHADSFLSPYRCIKTPPAILSGEGQISGNGVSVSWPVLRWDAQRSENVLISQNGTTCIADVSRVLQLIAVEKEQTGKTLPRATIPMFALGTIGIAEGEFVFEVRIDAHPSLTHTPRSVFAVGVTTRCYRGAHQKNPAYLFRSDGTLVAHSNDEVGVPYGCPYRAGSHITVHLSLIRKEMFFFLNGRPLGVAFRFRGVEDPEPLFPLVILGGEGDSASFVPPSSPQLHQHMMSPPADRDIRVAKSH